MGTLGGKAAIVTGAGQGVGRGIALALAKAGASVVVTGRTLTKCERTVSEIEAAGGRALALACDVSERDQVEQMVSVAVETFGQLDCLVNNAHTSRPLTLIADTRVKDLDLAFQGFHGMFYCMQASLPHLKASRGAVINLGSVAGMRGDAGFSAYAAAKEAVRAFSRSAAREWGEFGIRVNVICPFSDSPGLDYMIHNNPEFVKALTAETALGRYGSSENDVGQTAVFLASEAGSFITGQTINVDGGIWIAP
jgi:2-hydroxycyclohexanecarboxyl-CoA dehydrogenase